MINLIQTGIKEIEELAEQTKDCISLSKGFLKVGGIPQQIKRHMQDVLNSDKADYYEDKGLTNLLKEKIALSLKERYHTHIPTEHILITHGSIGGISIALLTICEYGDEILLPEPTYPIYENIVRLAKGQPVHVPAWDSHTSNNQLSWHFNIDALKEATTEKTKAIIISNPCNPIGQFLDKDVLHTLVAWCEERSIYLIVDEVYEDYIFDGTFYSITPLTSISKWVIRSHSFSKNFAMSGWRIGYIILPKHLTKISGIAQHSLIICPSVLGQLAAVYALDHPELIRPFYTTIHNNLTYLNEQLAPLRNAGIFCYQKPTAGIFLFIKTTKPNATQHCLTMLEQNKVSVVPGEKFGSSSTSFFRLCYARIPSIVKEGVKRIIDFWAPHS